MSSNRDFARKRLSSGDVVEYYSDNLVIFTESSEERWQYWAENNPISSQILFKMFGESAYYLLSEIDSNINMDIEVKEIIKTTSVKTEKTLPFIPESRIVYMGQDS